MSIERALISRARPKLIAGGLESLLNQEAVKGCDSCIYMAPVPLEPPFETLGDTAGDTPALEPIPGNQCHAETSYELKRANVWLHPEYELNWLRSEQFIKCLSSLKDRAGLEIIGNRESIRIRLLVSATDLALLQIAFRSQYELCELEVLSDGDTRELGSTACIAAMSDFYPPPPYSHLFTRPEELRFSPLEVAVTSLAELPTSQVGFIQVLFQPVPEFHDWHGNINKLLDLEYAIKLVEGLQPYQRVSSQPPSSELHDMARDTRSKAHNDKPIYAAALRTAIFGPKGDSVNNLLQINTFTNLYRHGGMALRSLGTTDYQKVIRPIAIPPMLTDGVVHRHGFILNSSELATMVHLPHVNRPEKVRSLVTLLDPLGEQTDKPSRGTPIGICRRTGTSQIVHIPERERMRSTHILARHGMGKSTLMEHMIIHDVNEGLGVAVLDPHGDLINRLTHLLPTDCLERIILMHFDDPDWIPLWNPVSTAPGQDLARTADDIVASIKGIVEGWGDRLENLLRHAVYALLHLPHASLLDISNLLRKGSEESEQLIVSILDIVENETARLFWKHDFAKYTAQDLNPPKHKLSKLLLSGTVSLMLSQPENRINFRRIMDTGQILLVDLSGIGTETRELLGSFILSLLHITTLSRSDLPIEKRKRFHIYCDEAHRFLRSAIEDLIVETRKYNVSLTLAHQYLRQFDQATRDGILTAGSTIIFNVDLNDSRYLVKDLQSKVHAEDMCKFEVGEAIARIGTKVIRLKTCDQAPIPTNSPRRQIIRQSHERYYFDPNRVGEIRHKPRKPTDSDTASSFLTTPNSEEFAYDELD